jgi:chemotaxis signal transduction protein
MPTSQGAIRCVLLQAGDRLCALPINQVRRIVRGVSTHPLPGAAPELLGLTESNGEPLAVLELAKLVGAPPGPQPAFPVTVIAWAGAPDVREVIGLACDAALAIVEVTVADITPTGTGALWGEATAEGRPVSVLNLERLGVA